jgi:hypothetical protein
MARQTRIFVPIRTLTACLYFSDGHGFASADEKKYKEKVGIVGVEA